MSNVTIIKGDLFSAPMDGIICHAVNCQGVWGSGIAKTFREKCPKAFNYYKRVCKENGADMLGSCLLAPDDGVIVGCLFTSVDYGANRDSVEEILDATHSAIKDLIFQYGYPSNNKPIHMCKINA